MRLVVHIVCCIILSIFLYGHRYLGGGEAIICVLAPPFGGIIFRDHQMRGQEGARWTIFGHSDTDF